MLRFQPSRFSWLLVRTLGVWVQVVQAHEYRYHYVSFDEVSLPSEFTTFFPAAINDSGRVYGTVCDDLCSDPHIAFYAHEAVTVLQSTGFANTVNAGGTVGGSVLIDPQNFIFQAALFRGDKVELIPPLPGEVFASVITLNDPGTALVWSEDASGQQTYALYRNGQTTPLDFGPAVTKPFLALDVRSMNNQGIIAGTEGSAFVDARGFRFNPRTGKTTLLYPLPTEPLAWGVGINNRGNVLGYSFLAAPPSAGGVERIGMWNPKGEFQTYFVEGTPQYPTISSRLLFNDNNLIVITLIQGERTSYLVPKPGVRLNLADLVDNLPSGQDLFYMLAMNNHGNMIGFGSQGTFLLERTGGRKR